MGSPTLTKAYYYVGRWLGDSRRESSDSVLKGYLHKARVLACDGGGRQAQALFALASYADALHNTIVQHRKSLEYLQGREYMRVWSVERAVGLFRHLLKRESKEDPRRAILGRFTKTVITVQSCAMSFVGPAFVERGRLREAMGGGLAVEGLQFCGRVGNVGSAAHNCGLLPSWRPLRADCGRGPGGGAVRASRRTVRPTDR